jgi:large subunit ribosomal protein L5
MDENPMRQIRIEKVTLNIGCGADKDKLERAKALLEKITGRKVFITKTHKRTTFGMARGKPIGVKVTLRKKEAIEFLKKCLDAVNNQIKASQFDNEGNFSLGIKEYIDIPGVKYDPNIGIIGMDVCVTFERPGYRVKRKKYKRSKIGKKHKIKKEEVIEWLKNNFKVSIIE